MGGKFFEIFETILPRCTHQGASNELLFVYFGSEGAFEKKDHPKKNSSLLLNE